MKQVYLIAAIVGAIVPYIFFIEFFLAEGLDIVTFLGGIFVNGAAGGFAADFFISSAVFWIYLGINREPGMWRYVLVNLFIGLSCALPYYLYIREARQVRQQTREPLTV